MSLYLTQPVAQQKLQQARVSAMSGHPDLAKVQYDALFHGNFPTLKLMCRVLDFSLSNTATTKKCI